MTSRVHDLLTVAFVSIQASPPFVKLLLILKHQDDTRHLAGRWLPAMKPHNVPSRHLQDPRVVVLDSGCALFQI